MTDANVAARLAAQRRGTGITHLNLDEQDHVTALVDGPLLRHDVRRHLTGQAS